MDTYRAQSTATLKRHKFNTAVLVAVDRLRYEERTAAVPGTTAVRGTDNVDLSVGKRQVFVLAAILTRAPAVTAGHNGTTLHSTTPAARSYRRTRPGMTQGTLVPYERVQSTLA